MNQKKSTAKLKKSTRIAVVVSQYNRKITSALEESCTEELKKAGVLAKNIKISSVPGAYELPYQCQQAAKTKKFDAVIALGAIIKGETPHFDFIAQAVAHGIMQVSLNHNLPVVFGVLTTHDLKQAQNRIKKGKRGDKGLEAAHTAIELLNQNQ